MSIYFLEGWSHNTIEGIIFIIWMIDLSIILLKFSWKLEENEPEEANSTVTLMDFNWLGKENYLE